MTTTTCSQIEIFLLLEPAWRFTITDTTEFRLRGRQVLALHGGRFSKFSHALLHLSLPRLSASAGETATTLAFAPSASREGGLLKVKVSILAVDGKTNANPIAGRRASINGYYVG